MLPDSATVLLAGGDPDLLLLRSAMLAATGIWSLRVRNADQAIQVLGFVPCELVILCYTLDEADQQQVIKAVQDRGGSVKVLRVAPGDDCSGTGFLRKVEDAFETAASTPKPISEPPRSNSRMVR